MVCDAVQNNLWRPAGGNSGASLNCIAAPAGFFVGDLAMKRIPLTKGKFALVDDDDFERLNRHKWYASCPKWTSYAARRDSNRKVVRMHRIIMNTPPGLFTDHINGNGLDNRKCNLRVCTLSQNNRHRRKGAGPTSSRFKGVSIRRPTNNWQAAICFNSKDINLGYFEDEIEAAKAYDAKARELFGEYALTNF